MATWLENYMNLWVEAPHHLTMFGIHWSSASGDKTYLMCHATSQRQVIEGYDVMGLNSSLFVINPLGLLAVCILIAEIWF